MSVPVLQVPGHPFPEWAPSALVYLALAVVGGCGGEEAGQGGTEDLLPPSVVTASGVEMVSLPGGWFEMGDDRGNGHQSPAHRVWVDPFLMDKYEVSQDQYQRLQISNASRFPGDRLPAEQQTWIDAIRFCNERSYAEGLDPCYDEETMICDFSANGYRLPTEAEWEYAARAGTATRYFFGADPRRMSQYAWGAENAGEQTQEVGARRPNPWGLHDMYGNVAEWVNDYYGEDYYGSSPESNPKGPQTGEYRVLRGGSWKSLAEQLSSSARAFSASVDDGCMVSDDIGFRCVRAPLPEEMAAGSYPSEAGVPGGS